MDERTYLVHFGIKGQKWGVRRYQNEDGSLTAAGRARYGTGEKRKGLWTRGKEAVARKRQRFADAHNRSKRENTRILTDVELKEKIARMRMEDDYNTLYSKLNPQKKSRIKNFLSKAADTAVNSLAQKAGNALADAFVGKFTKKEMANLNYYEDLSKISDDDLAKATKRAQAENQYEAAWKLKKEREAERKKAAGS